jgi:hypothetical protein
MALPRGGATLTPFGAEVLERYRRINDRAAATADDDIAALARRARPASSAPSEAFNSSRRAEMSLAAASASRQPIWAPRSIPNSAMMPSPMNLSTRPPVPAAGSFRPGTVIRSSHDEHRLGIELYEVPELLA